MQADAAPGAGAEEAEAERASDGLLRREVSRDVDFVFNVGLESSVEIFSV
jgi:hypothetical protein